MSGYYPDGCTQASHDAAFGELGPSPAELAAEADSQNDERWEREQAEYPHASDCRVWVNEECNCVTGNPALCSAQCPNCEGCGDIADVGDNTGNPTLFYRACPRCGGTGRV